MGDALDRRKSRGLGWLVIRTGLLVALQDLGEEDRPGWVEEMLRPGVNLFRIFRSLETLHYRISWHDTDHDFHFDNASPLDVAILSQYSWWVFKIWISRTDTLLGEFALEECNTAGSLWTTETLINAFYCDADIFMKCEIWCQLRHGWVYESIQGWSEFPTWSEMLERLRNGSSLEDLYGPEEVEMLDWYRRNLEVAKRFDVCMVCLQILETRLCQKHLEEAFETEDGVSMLEVILDEEESEYSETSTEQEDEETGDRASLDKDFDGMQTDPLFDLYESSSGESANANNVDIAEDKDVWQCHLRSLF